MSPHVESMLETAAALAMFFTMAYSNVSNPEPAGPIPYEEAVAADMAAAETAATENSSAEAALSPEQLELMGSDPDWRASIRLYHAGGGGATGNDSLGCRPVPMRTVAVDPRVIPRRTKLFIAETVGMPLENGGRHDGYWYASDTGGAIRGEKIDLFTGHGRGSMRHAMAFNMRTLNIAEAGRFDGCPPAWETASN